MFSSLIACLEGGKFDSELTQALQTLVARLRDMHGGRGGKPAGKISMFIDFRWEDGTVQTKQSFTVEPSVTRTPDRFFVSPDGALTQRSPQNAMPLKGL